MKYDFEKYNDLHDSLRSWLLSDRMSNYGYDLKCWRRIQSQRQRAKTRLKRTGIFPAEMQSELAGRLRYDEKTGWSYIVGQSQNEEITNLILRLTKYSGGWKS